MPGVSIPTITRSYPFLRSCAASVHPVLEVRSASSSSRSPKVTLMRRGGGTRYAIVYRAGPGIQILFIPDGSLSFPQSATEKLPLHPVQTSVANVAVAETAGRRVDDADGKGYIRRPSYFREATICAKKPTLRARTMKGLLSKLWRVR